MKGLVVWLILSVVLLAQHSLVFAEHAEKAHATILYSAEMPLIGRKIDGGYARLASALAQQRQGDVPVFFLFGGNSLGPSPMSTYDSGSHIVDILNSLDPDAMGVTKREYSYFEEQLSLRAYEAVFPMIASNIQDPFDLEMQDGLVSSVIIDKGNVKLGVLAVIDPAAVQQYLLKRIEVLDIKNSIIKQAQLLRNQGANVIALLHGRPFTEITELINENAVDFSLLKDRHLELPPEVKLLSTNAFQSREVILDKPSEIAIIDIIVDHNGSVEIDWVKESLVNFPEDPDVAQQRNDYLRRLNRLLDMPLAKVFEPFSTIRKHVRTEESRFGNFIADAMLNFTQADLAIVNSGIIRGDTRYPDGHTFTRKNLAEEMPYRSGLVKLEIRGIDIINAIEKSLVGHEDIKGKFPLVSNMEIRFDGTKQAGQRLISIKIGGQPVVENKIYTLATTDYLYGGGDGYSDFKNGKLDLTGRQTLTLLSDIVMKKIIAENRVGSPLQQRIVKMQ